MFGHLLALVRDGDPQERATAVAVLVSTISAVFLVVGSFAAVAAYYRGLAGNALLLGLVVLAVCWMAFVLLGDVVLARLFGAT
ncbi:hypothetical protein G9C85_15875 [Halorubellus sp. JP-L1]|uniref:hypothetical protein n=1 Tax=Halorubellus sp. JP-L1 TaxID=2715753 RepID=UPI0014073626|nr:hypothetical protein [Halorubellus sp. JP-L1]NHN43096.1 hypothetical protein [Halorubellus sp. JP-L1]